jgi:SprA-related family
LNLRIVESDSTAPPSAVRPGAPAARTRTPVSETARAGNGARADEGVVIRLSPAAQRILARSPGGDQDGPTVGGGGNDANATDEAAGSEPQVAAKSRSTGQSQTTGQLEKLSSEDRDVVSRLAARDTAVRAHEAAHQAAAQGLGGGASFSYETGPDGRRYAVGGEVPVSLRPGRTPQETINNAQIVRSAALAPADPSAQDLAVASQASQMEAEARQEIVRNRSDAAASGASGSTAARGSARAGGGNAAPVAGGNGEEGSGAERVARSSPRDVEQDQVMIFSALKAERATINGHSHADGGGCALCARAVARYAS